MEQQQASYDRHKHDLTVEQWFMFDVTVREGINTLQTARPWGGRNG